MAEANLHFVITKVDGTQVTQDFNCPSDAVEGVMNQMLAQFSQVGMLKKDGTKYTLLPASQISLVECELPTLVIAGPSETAKVAAAAGSLKRIIT
jgi:hypothetical protein